MKRTYWIGAAAVASLILTASGAAQAQTLTIGLTTSQTGSQNVDGTNQMRGFEMWRDDVNKAGGIKAGGKSYQVKFVSYDDQSANARVQQLYAKLITDDKADFLFSPYSSPLVATAAIISEQYGKVMLTAGGAEQKTYETGNKGLYQIYTPADHYFASSVELIKQLGPDSKVALVTSDDSFSQEVVAAAREQLKAINVTPVFDEKYDPNTTDFGPIINKIAAAKANVVLGGGHYQDGATLARQMHEQKVPMRFVSLLVAPDSAQFATLGDAANGVAVPSQWEPSVTFKPQFGPTPAEFNAAFKAKFNTDSPYHAAGGYATGLILQHAIEQAGSIDQDKVAKALDATDAVTFFGPTKFAGDPGHHGLQVAHQMVLAQWQQTSKLTKEVIAPADAQTAKPMFGK